MGESCKHIIKHFILINVIGIIDSGLGGANVILECIKYYNEDFVYLIDNKNCPYGNKDTRLLKQILNDNICYLKQNFDLDFIIIACNTLSSLFDHNSMLEEKLPVLKTFPKVEKVKNKGKEVLIFATKNTLKNSKQIKYLKLNYPKIKMVSIKGLAKEIDNFLINNNPKNITKKIKNKLKLNKINYISLGCTHFKYIENIIKNNTENKGLQVFNCEEIPAKNSKWLLRKNKNKNTIKIILSQENEQLMETVKDIFKSVNNLIILK